MTCGLNGAIASCSAAARERIEEPAVGGASLPGANEARECVPERSKSEGRRRPR